MKPVRIAVTGAAGQLGYSLLFRLAAGEALGKDVPVILHLLEVPAALKAVEGVVMELHDCAFANLAGVEVFDEPSRAFDGVHWALLVGAAPRQKGMSRGDLLQKNASIFAEQGKSLLKAAADIRCIVVGNPCNTNALITLSQAPDIPPTRFFAMTTLDENRAQHQLAQKAGVTTQDVERLAIWGNHSATMVADFENALIAQKPAQEVITDQNWLQSEFFERVQQRGAAIIKARGKSSAASAASSCIDLMCSLSYPTAEGKFFSAGVYTENNPYALGHGLVFSFPLRVLSEQYHYEVVGGLKHSAFLHDKLKATEEELLSEKAAIQDLL